MNTRQGVIPLSAQAAGKRAIFFGVGGAARKSLTERGGSNALQLPACQCRLEEVGNIQATTVATAHRPRADQCVHLIDPAHCILPDVHDDGKGNMITKSAARLAQSLHVHVAQQEFDQAIVSAAAYQSFLISLRLTAAGDWHLRVRT